MKINYKELLIKYMQVVRIAEGVDYIDTHYTSDLPCFGFEPLTLAECNELKRLVKLSEKKDL